MNKLLIMLSFFYFVLPKINSWVVLDFSQVNELYSNERAKYRSQWGGDPFFKKSTTELRRYCNELRVSGIYGMLGASVPPPPMIIAPIVPAIKQTYELKYRYQNVIGQKDSVPMFPCLTHANDGYWYLSYGFKNDYLFVFHNVGMDSDNKGPIFEVKGLLERSPRLDRSKQRGYALEVAFRNSIAGQNSLPDLAGKSSQHFRLCSLIIDTIRRTYSNQKVYTINFGLDYDNNQTPVRRLVTFQFLRRKDIFAHAIPCAMNKSFKNPNFLVVTDRTDPSSVFVLVEKQDHLDPRTRYIVKYYIRDVSVLKNWND